MIQSTQLPMSIRCQPSKYIFLVLWIVLHCFPGLVVTATVTLESIKIYKTHEWFKGKPTVYFQCKGENRTILPDVKETKTEYTFKGEESWQPLVEFSGTKCKRCGFYEQDTLKSDDVFDEWEFCPSDFSTHGGKYTRTVKDEFDATFLCLKCDFRTNESGTHVRRKKMHPALIILIIVLVATVTIIGMVAAYKYWQKKKREKDQARFLKLFDDGDDIEDELGLGTII